MITVTFRQLRKIELNKDFREKLTWNIGTTKEYGMDTPIPLPKIYALAGRQEREWDMLRILEAVDIRAYQEVLSGLGTANGKREELLTEAADLRDKAIKNAKIRYSNRKDKIIETFHEAQDRAFLDAVGGEG